VSLDLKEALSDLEDLQQALSATASSSVKADDSSQLAEMGTRFFKGLSAVHLVCNTGQHARLKVALSPETKHAVTLQPSLVNASFLIYNLHVWERLCEMKHAKKCISIL